MGEIKNGGLEAPKPQITRWILIKIGLTFVLLWFCWVPEAKLDLQHTYSMTGLIKFSGGTKTSNYIFMTVNEKKKQDFTQNTYVSRLFYTSYSVIGAYAGLRKTPELDALIKNETPVEVVFARDYGNAVFKKDLVVEIRHDGETLSTYSKADRLQEIKDIRLRQLKYLSPIIFLLLFPLILNPNLFNKTSAKSN